MDCIKPRVILSITYISGHYPSHLKRWKLSFLQQASLFLIHEIGRFEIYGFSSCDSSAEIVAILYSLLIKFIAREKCKNMISGLPSSYTLWWCCRCSRRKEGKMYWTKKEEVSHTGQNKVYEEVDANMSVLFTKKERKEQFQC